MTTLLLATRNAHKVAEIRAILGEGFRCLALDDFPGAPEVVEDAGTFAGNAAKKAVELARWLALHDSRFTLHASRCFVLADDSGLEVDSLDGAPGVHSARFAAMDSGQPGNARDPDNIAKLLRLLANVPPARRTARFRCVIALAALPSASQTSPPQLFEGDCEGRLVFEPLGEGGFGYDPLFVPEGFDKTFAELPEKEKNRLSHRSKALGKLRAHLRLIATGGNVPGRTV